MNSVLRIGHKGAAGYEPENTLRSFKKALELGVDMIEFDIRVCKSGELVVIHDKKANRTTNGRGYISWTMFNDLRKLDAGKGEKIPTLEEVLDLVDKRAWVNIELKSKRTAEPVSIVIKKYIENGWNPDNFLVSSFHKKELKKLHKLNPNIKIGVITESFLNRYVNFAKKINAYSLHPHINLVSKKIVETAHKNKLKVFVWTVNKPNDIKRIESLGVDGIFSDFPDRVATKNYA